nr:conserved uncharacterized protein [uncultured bacterium]
MILHRIDASVSGEGRETEAVDAIEEALTGKLYWVVSGQTTAKPKNDYFEKAGQIVWRHNEDRFRHAVTENGLLAAVSDGAGSSGMYCGAWAEALVGRLPETPIASLTSLNQWIDGFWQEFSTEYKQLAAGDPGKNSKFVREGSFATLMACWLEERGNEGLTLHWCGYGDSPLCVFGRNGERVDLIASHPASLRALEHDPHLLNWKDLPEEKSFRSGSVDLDGPATVVLASDGVGQFVLLRYLAEKLARQSAEAGVAHEGPTREFINEFVHLIRSGNSKLADLARNHMDNVGPGFAENLANLRDSLRSEAEFLDNIRDNHAAGLLPNDDSTLVMIDIHRSPR